jgi:hypothetical protein
VTTRPPLPPRKHQSLYKNGGDQPGLPHSLDKNGGGITSPVAVTKRCTTLIATMYTEHADATSFSAALTRGQVGTALGVAVPT